MSTTGAAVRTGGNARTAVFLQDACYLHRYIRSPDLSAIVERPERLRAVKLGISAAIARLEETSSKLGSPEESTGDELVAALEKLDLLTEAKVEVVDVVNSSAALSLLQHPAVKFVHGDIEGDIYLEKLVALSKNSLEKIGNGESEIPADLSQGDLYLCPESLDAIQGALGTVCEAVDKVMQSPSPTNAFVVIRPPGHHCGEDTPSGFCFVNNVAVAAAHAHLRHKVKKAVIFDIDLHHGNGTQSIVWQINEETYRQTLEESNESSNKSDGGLVVFYGSIHDVLSYPCEDGKIELVQAASASIHGAHGQFIENIHLEPYASDADFWNTLYPKYLRLLTKAEEFLHGSEPSDVIVFISCGFDACEHEYASMSRHGRKVPASFYHRFARDTRVFANKHANGRVISVLEGGYSDRALISGAMAHTAGLADPKRGEVDESWWDVENLSMLEKSLKKRRGGKTSMTTPPPAWLDRATAIYTSIDSTKLPPPPAKAPILPTGMNLRGRRAAGGTPVGSTVVSPKASPQPKRTKGKGVATSPVEQQTASVDDVLANMASLQLGTATPEAMVNIKEDRNEVDLIVDAPHVQKKLPRVILKVKGPDGSSAV